MKNRLIIGILSLVVATFGLVFFINKSNDHQECNTVKKTSTDKNGNQVVFAKHVCNEKYSF